MNSTTLQKHKELHDEVVKLGDLYNENYVTMKEQSADKKVDYTRDDGEVVNLTERIIWDELYYHPKGYDSAAGAHLKKEYPQLFELQDEYEEKKKAMEEFEAKEFGFTGNEMSLYNLVSLIDTVVEFRLNKK